MNPISAKIITAASSRLLSIETCRKQCEVVPIDLDSDAASGESHPDDELLLNLQDAAVDHAERFTGRSILLRIYEFALDDFPRRCAAPRLLQPSIEIPYPPLIEVIRFAFGDDSESELELGTDYTIDTYGDKAKLRPVLLWPTVITPAANLITCQYVAGYTSEVEPDTDSVPLPGGIRAAILLTLAHLYANREASVDKALIELPLGVEALLRPHRVLLGMA